MAVGPGNPGHVLAVHFARPIVHDLVVLISVVIAVRNLLRVILPVT